MIYGRQPNAARSEQGPYFGSYYADQYGQPTDRALQSRYEDIDLNEHNLGSTTIRSRSPHPAPRAGSTPGSLTPSQRPRRQLRRTFFHQNCYTVVPSTALRPSTFLLHHSPNISQTHLGNHKVVNGSSTAGRSQASSSTARHALYDIRRAARCTTSTAQPVHRHLRRNITISNDLVTALPTKKPFPSSPAIRARAGTAPVLQPSCFSRLPGHNGSFVCPTFTAPPTSTTNWHLQGLQVRENQKLELRFQASIPERSRISISNTTRRSISGLTSINARQATPAPAASHHANWAPTVN